MKWQDNLKARLLRSFEGSFFNERNEFIAHKSSNTYFIFANCQNEEEVKCKVLEWFSRAASKGMPYSEEWRNKKFRAFMLDGINIFLRTDFSFRDMDVIYTHLGNACNHQKTLDFVRSGYDMTFFDSLS